VRVQRKVRTNKILCNRIDYSAQPATREEAMRGNQNKKNEKNGSRFYRILKALEEQYYWQFRPQELPMGFK
jgi:hypothetical protein